VPARDRNQLTGVEQQALVLIREMRRQIAAVDISAELRTPARLARYVITLYHGHVQLRMSRIALELGVTMRTLQRSFRKIFRTSMRDYQIETRLNFARYLLSSNPDLKMSVIAKYLGYDDPNVFGRFFRDHADDSPHAWSEAQQARRNRDDSGNGNSNG
jgi:AraC-like DNA-binding protein